jgi:hypothetical protein
MMAGLDLFWYLLVASAGAGFLITLIINSLNDWLLKKRWSVIHPDTMISVDIFKTMNPVQAMKEGMYMIFLGGWVGTLLFIILWTMPFMQLFSGGNIWIAAGVYSFAIYVVMMLVFLPIVHRGLFGVLYHPRVPYWSFVLLAIFAILLALIVPVIYSPF